jgi:hypothetical protein
MAREFNANGDKIAYTTSNLVNALSAYSIAFWAIRDTGGSGTSYGSLAYKGNTTTTRYWRIENDNGDGGWGLVFITQWSTTQGAWSISYPDTNWHHYVITYNHTSTSNDPVIYKDGSSVGITERLTPAGSAGTDSSDLTIGNVKAGNQGWDGKIAEFSIFDRVLNSTEVSDLYNGDSATFLWPDDLVFHCDLLNGNIKDLISGTGADTSTSDFTHPLTLTYPTQSNPRYLVQGSI